MYSRPNMTEAQFARRARNGTLTRAEKALVRRDNGLSYDEEHLEPYLSDREDERRLAISAYRKLNPR